MCRATVWSAARTGPALHGPDRRRRSRIRKPDNERLQRADPCPRPSRGSRSRAHDGDRHRLDHRRSLGAAGPGGAPARQRQRRGPARQGPSGSRRPAAGRSGLRAPVDRPARLSLRLRRPSPLRPPLQGVTGQRPARIGRRPWWASRSPSARDARCGRIRAPCRSGAGSPAWRRARARRRRGRAPRCRTGPASSSRSGPSPSRPSPG